jgi:hypothetical protein
MLTPYQFASNTPIGCIDLDGLEAKESTTYKYTGNVFIVYSMEKYNILKADARNKNWDIIFNEGLNADLGVKIKAYVEAMEATGKGNKINNLVINAHGSDNIIESIPLPPAEEAAREAITAAGGTPAARSEDDLLTHEEVYGYAKRFLDEKDPYNTTITTLEEKRQYYLDNYSASALESVDALYLLGTHLSSDANIVFKTCHTGNGSFMKNVFILFEATGIDATSMTMYGNKDLCQSWCNVEVEDEETGETIEYTLILGASTSYGSSVQYGWTKVTATKDEKKGRYQKAFLNFSREDIIKHLYINPTGDPIEFKESQ